jgi:Holliday junction DNA helicase RuvB
VNFKTIAHNVVEQPYDLSAILTSLSENDALIYEVQSENVPDSLTRIIGTALSSFALDIVVGKGTAAQSIRLDLPKFTFVACVANVTTPIRKLLPFFEYVIKLDNTALHNLCVAQLQNSANVKSISIDNKACELIISKAQYNVTQSERYLKRILEYISVQKEKASCITSELSKHVFDISGISEISNPPSNEDEMFSILRDIQETLHRMCNEMHQMREDVSSSLSRIEDHIDYTE